MPSLNVLIVEDNINTAELLAVFLKKEGYAAQLAASAGAARELISRQMPDFAFLDIDLGEGAEDGIELAAWIRQHANMPFVFLTSYSDRLTLERAKLVNPNGYLTKPPKEADVRVSLEFGLHAFVKSTLKKTEEAPAEDGETVLLLPDCLFVKEKRLYVKVPYPTILWLEADGNYTHIFTSEGKHTVRSILKEVESKLPASRFLRVHRSFVINTDNIVSINSAYVAMPDKKIPINRQTQQGLLARVNVISSE